MAEKEEKKEAAATEEKAEKHDGKAEKIDEKADAKASKDSKTKKKVSKNTDEEAKEEKVKKVRIKRRHIPLGHAYVHASYNNTIVTLTEPNGNVIAWGSAGNSGFKGARKSTPYAAQVAAENAAEKSKLYGLEKIHVFVKGVGQGREQAIRGLVSSGLELVSISDMTPMPHNGCRKKKQRRN